MHFYGYVRAAVLEIAGTSPFRLRQQLFRALQKALVLEADYGRPQLWLAFILLCGAAGYFALPATPPAILLYPPAVLAVLFATALRRHLIACAVALSLASLLFGAIAADIATRRLETPRILAATQAVAVSGTVLESEDRLERRPRILLAVHEIAGWQAGAIPPRLSLTGKKLANLKPGDQVLLQARLKSLPIATHPGAYDPAFVGYFDGIGGLGTVAAPPQQIEFAEPSLTMKALIFIESWRAEMTARIKAGLPGETGAVAASLVTGDRAGVSSDLLQAFNGSGLMHVLSISGLHMILVAGGIFWLARLLLTFAAISGLHLPVKKIAAVLAILTVTLYEIISGGEVATTRSYIMILIAFGALLIDRPALSMRNVALSALLIAAISPQTVTGASFQMSFAATAALIAAHERKWFRNIRPWDKTLLARGLAFIASAFVLSVCTSLIAELATLPFVLHHFHRISWFGIAGNVLALVFIEFIIMPGVLLTIFALPFGLEGWTLPLLGFGVDRMNDVARFVAAFPGALSGVPGFRAGAMLLCAFGIAWACFWRSRIAAFAIVFYVAGMIIGLNDRPADLYISPTGMSVAARAADDKLTLIALPRENFLLKRWLEADGDRRSLDDPHLRLSQRCDESGCTVQNPRLGLIAVSLNSSSIAEDCQRADLLILPRAQKPPLCERPILVIDKEMIARANGLALTYQGSGERPRLRAYAKDCSARPWCPPGGGEVEAED